MYTWRLGPPLFVTEAPYVPYLWHKEHPIEPFPDPQTRPLRAISMSKLALLAATAVGYAIYNYFFGSSNDTDAPSRDRPTPPPASSYRGQTPDRTFENTGYYRDSYFQGYTSTRTHAQAPRQQPYPRATQGTSTTRVKENLRTSDYDSVYGSSFAPSRDGLSHPASAPPAASANVKQFITADDLREQARQRFKKMLEAREQAKSARRMRDYETASFQNQYALEHETKMKTLNKAAAKLIFEEKNKDNPQGTVDLHDLYVDEAVEYAKQELQAATRRPNNVVYFIVGKGLHTKDGKPKIRPAVEELCKKRRLPYSLDPANAGVLIVQC